MKYKNIIKLKKKKLLKYNLQSPVLFKKNNSKKIIFKEVYFNSLILDKFISSIARDGRKYLSYRFFSLSLYAVQVLLKRNPIYTFFTIIDFLKPILNYKNIIKNKQVVTTFLVPVINRRRQLYCSIKILVKILKLKKQKNKKILFLIFLFNMLYKNNYNLVLKYQKYAELFPYRVASSFRWIKYRSSINLNLDRKQDKVKTLYKYKPKKIKKLFIFREQSFLQKKYEKYNKVGIKYKN